MDCFSGGSWPDLQGHGGHWPHSFLSLVCPAHLLLHPLPMPEYQTPPSTRNLLPQPGKESSMEGTQNSWWSWSSSPRGFAHSASPRGRGQPGESCALRSSGRLQSRSRALGSVPLAEERWQYLLRKAFISDLGKLTIICRASVKCILFWARVQVTFL